MDDSDDADSIDLLGALGQADDAPAHALPPACRLSEVTIAHEGTGVLDAVSLAFDAEACTVIMGPSGSGKSTLLKAAAGLSVPDTGRVEILGMDPAKASDREIEALRKRNGFVFQDGALWQNLTLYQNLALPLQYHYAELGETEIRRRVEALLRELGATARLTLRPSQVSAGECKIVSFVRAIVGDPELIFMDEPTTSVDTERVDLLIRKLRELKQRRRTIIAVTHNARIASQIADRLVVMKEGRILRSGSLRDISRSGDPEVERILTDVLSETATYDGDILELLDPDANPFFEQS